MTYTDCPAFKVCPEKPVRKDYADENKYLIDLESGVWSCQKTIEKLCKENEQLKQQIKKIDDFIQTGDLCSICKFDNKCNPNECYSQNIRVYTKWELKE